jgi:DNA-binding HxlR family transcriptional regulator
VRTLGLSPRPPEAFEPVEVTLDALQGRLRPLVVWSLFWGPRSFFELAQAIPRPSAPTLRHGLSEMERSGLVRLEEQARTPREVRFALTPRGESLKPVVAVMYEWGLRVQSASSSTPRHPRAKRTRRTANRPR